MRNKTTIFLSNELEELAKKFLDYLSTQDPFQNICCVLPHQSLKTWLFEYALKNKQMSIFVGVKFLSIDEALKNILTFSGRMKEEFIHPFFFQILCSEKLKSFSHQSTDPSIHEYLQSPNHRLSLSQKLGNLFFDYSIYHFHEAIKWKSSKDWQKSLWYEIFIENQELFPCSYISENLTSDLLSFKQMHFFGLDYICEAYFDFFYRLGTKIPIFHYVFSPTQEYWEESLSFFEQRKKKQNARKNHISSKVIHENERYLHQVHPFLANWGKIGRNYLDIFNHYDLPIEEAYILPDSKFLLHHIQSEILQCVLPKKFECLQKDESLQIHQTGASKLREVEILFEHLYYWIFKCKILPQDILILCPNIQEYTPYIHFVFSAENETIPYKIHHLCLSSQSFLADLTFKWFSLVQSRWDHLQIVNLLQNPLMQRKLQISQKEATQWIQWINTSKILWGIHKDHIKNVSPERDEKKFERTWEKMIKKMLSSLVAYPEKPEELKFTYPLSGIDYSDVNSVYRFFKFFKELVFEIQNIENTLHRRVSQWASLLEDFLKKFVVNQNETNEKSAESILQTYVGDLRAIARNKDCLFEFQIFFQELKNRLMKPNASYRSSVLNGVQFSSMSSPTSAKAIYILGANESMLSQPFRSLDRLERKKIPNPKDQFRYQFLKAFLYAKEFFWVSYAHKASADGTEVPPAFCVQELISLLEEKSCSKCIFTHPNVMYHPDYFKKGTNLKNFSSKSKKFAKIYHEEIKQKKDASIFSKPTKLPMQGSYVIELQNLFQFAKNPLNYYFQTKLKTKLERKLYEEKDTSSFELSFLDKYYFRESLFNKQSERLIEKYKKTDSFPLGPFEKIAIKQCETDLQELQSILQFHSLSSETLKTLKLDYTTKNEEGGVITLSPIKIEDPSVEIIGSLDKISSRGLILFASSRTADIVHHWPRILIYLYLAYQQNLPSEILFLKEKKTFSLSENETEDFLKKYLRLFLFAQQTPVPFQKPFIEAFKQKSFKVWKKNYNQITNREDIYLQWIKRNCQISLTKENFEKWLEIFEETYSCLL